MKRISFAVTLWILSSHAQGVSGDAGRVLAESRAAAMNYSQWLPNLMCTEFIRRDVDWGVTGNWAPADSLTAQVTYFERKESYKLIAHNQHSANQRFENLAGAISEGEFGSMLRWIFDPAAKAEFESRGRQTVRGQSTFVFGYRVSAANSRMKMAALSQSAFVGFDGEVWIDANTALVVHLTAEAQGPQHFPIRDSFVSIDYDWTALNGHQYLVPVSAETRMTEIPPASWKATLAPPPGGVVIPDSCVSCGPLQPLPKTPLAITETRYRNRIEFRNYKEFTADSKLKWAGDEQKH